MEALDTMQYIIYGIKRGQNRGIAHKKKKNDTKSAMLRVWNSTIIVCNRLLRGKLSGANLIPLLSQPCPAVRPLTRLACFLSVRSCSS